MTNLYDEFVSRERFWEEQRRLRYPWLEDDGMPINGENGANPGGPAREEGSQRRPKTRRDTD